MMILIPNNVTRARKSSESGHKIAVLAAGLSGIGAQTIKKGAFTCTLFKFKAFDWVTRFINKAGSPNLIYAF